MSQNKYVSFSILLCCFIFLLPCAGNSISQPPIVETEHDSAWIEYNKKAVTNNAPILDAIIFCKKVGSVSKQPDELTNIFSLKDDNAYIYLKWNNIFDKHTATIKIYDPREILFNEWGSTFNYNGPIWNLWTWIYVKDAPASRLPGKWTAEIYMDGELVSKRHFVIADNREYPKASLNEEGIGIINFFNENSKTTRFNHALPLYIGQMFTIDFPQYRTVLPWESNKLFRIDKNINIKESMSKILNSAAFSAYTSKHNLNIVFVGSYYDSTSISEDKIFKIYMIDAKKKLLIKEMTVRWASHRAYEGEGNMLILEASEKVYENILSNCKDEMNRLLGGAANKQSINMINKGIPQTVNVVEEKPIKKMDNMASPPKPTEFLKIPAETKKIKIAIMEFQNLNEESKRNNYGSMFAEMLTTSFVGSEAFKITEREQLKKVAQELQYTQSGIIDVSQAKQVGKLVGADAIVTGSVTKIGDDLRLDARIIDVESGIILTAEKITGKVNLRSISDMAELIVNNLVNKFYGGTK